MRLDGMNSVFNLRTPMNPHAILRSHTPYSGYDMGEACVMSGTIGFRWSQPVTRKRPARQVGFAIG